VCVCVAGAVLQNSPGHTAVPRTHWSKMALVGFSHLKQRVFVKRFSRQLHTARSENKGTESILKTIVL